MTQGTEPAHPSIVVVERVAEREGVDPIRLTPALHDVIDPDALDRLCDGTTSGFVAFTYCGYSVTVSGDGVVSIEEPHDASAGTEAVPAASATSD